MNGGEGGGRPEQRRWIGSINFRRVVQVSNFRDWDRVTMPFHRSTYGGDDTVYVDGDRTQLASKSKGQVLDTVDEAALRSACLFERSQGVYPAPPMRNCSTTHLLSGQHDHLPSRSWLSSQS